MYDAIKDMNEEMAKKFLETEKRVGKMMALLTGLFFLVYIPNICLRAVSIVKYIFMHTKMSVAKISEVVYNELSSSFIFLMFVCMPRSIQTLESPSQQEQ